MRRKIAKLLRKFNVQEGNKLGLKPEEINRSYKHDKEAWKKLSHNEKEKHRLVLEEAVNAKEA